jgi:V/A-type H+/Na+-transporting ATPase subunit C
LVRVDLSDYGYVNARVRGMRSYLLGKDFFEKLVESEDFEALHNLLEQTVYRREINEAVLLDPEKPDYDYALNMNLVASLNRIYDSTGGQARQLTAQLLSRYDLENIKAILRGRQGGATAGEIMNIMIPVGNLDMEDLEEITEEKEVGGVVSAMEIKRMPFAKPLKEALPSYREEDLDLSVLELALDKFHFADNFEKLKGKKDENSKMVRQVFIAEVDMRNISTLVRIRGIKLKDSEAMNFMIPGGSLTHEQFVGLHRLGDIGRMVSDYPDPGYRRVLERALAEYQELDVVAFDRELEREMVREAVGMSNVDVLGIGVIIGYIWAKKNEMVNLRIVFKGKAMDQPQAEIRRDLFFVERGEGEGR